MKTLKLFQPKSFSSKFVVKMLKFSVLLLVVVSFSQCQSISDEDKKAINSIIDEGIAQMEKEKVDNDFFSKLGYPEVIPEIIFSGDPEKIELSAKINKNLMDFEQGKKINTSAIHSETYLKIVNYILKEQNQKLLPGDVEKKLPKKWYFIEDYRLKYVGEQLWNVKSCDAKTTLQTIECANNGINEAITHLKGLKDLINSK
jgi:hypothetical protein